MRSRIYFLICLFHLGCVSTAVSQDWEKYFEKEAEYFETGNYKKAYKQLNKLKKKSAKKLGVNNKYVLKALMQEAAHSQALGHYIRLKPEIDHVINLSVELERNNSLEHVKLLKRAAEICLDAGFITYASEYADKAEETLSSNYLTDEDLEADLHVVETEILSASGFYNQAIDRIRLKSDYYRGRATTKIQDKREWLRRRREYARMMILLGNTMRNQGDYLSSDSVFVSTTNWIEDNLGKKDILYSQCLFYNTRLLEENGLQLDALVKFYQEAYSYVSGKYEDNHPMNIKILYGMALAYRKGGNEGRFSYYATQMDKITKGYDDESIYHYYIDLLHMEVDMMEQDYEGLGEQVNHVINYNQGIPKNHGLEVKLLEYSIAVDKYHRDFSEVERTFDDILKIKKELYGQSSPHYHFTKLDLANYYVDYTDSFDEARKTYQNSFEKVTKKEVSTGHQSYINVLNHIAKFYQETDEYKKAEETLDEALYITQKKYDDTDIEYANELEKIASLLVKLGNYKEAQDHLERVFAILDQERLNKITANYMARSVITNAKLDAIFGELDEAENGIIRADDIRAQYDLSMEDIGVGVEDDLASLYIQLGRLHEAEEMITNSIETKTELYGEKSRQLSRPYTLKANFNLIVGEYNDAQKMASSAFGLTEGVFSDRSTKTVPSRLVLAKIYSAIGDFEKAERELNQAIDILTERFGRNHVDVAKAISELALVKYYQNGDLREIEELFLEAEGIIVRQIGGFNPTYAEVMKNLAIVNIAFKRFDDAEDYLESAGKIWRKKLSKRNNINAATIDILQGDIYYQAKEYSRADNKYKVAFKRYEKFFNSNHPEYVRVLSKLSRTYYMNGNINKAQNVIEEVLTNYQEFIQYYFPALSEREKAKFWNKIKTDYEFYNSLIISHNRMNSSLIGELYNNALMTKALLLSTSKKVRERILNSGDEELIGTFNDWVSKKEFLTYALSMSIEQLEQNNIDVSRLSQDIENLEKGLSEKSEDFNKSFDNELISWEDVQGALDKSDVAVEVIRFRYFDHTFTDSIIYALIFVKNEKRAKPGLILLGNGRDLESKYLKVYRNSIKYKLADNRSFGAFWKPIAEQLGQAGTIYLSPDGVYNQVNLEAIPTDNGEYVIDQADIVLVSNTKELFTRTQQSESDVSSNYVMMVGDPKFYVNSTADNSQAVAGVMRSQSGTIDRLPGTAVEVTEVKHLLQNKGFRTLEYQEEEATETQIKSVTSPKIVHIATHGFFMDGETDDGESGLLDELKTSSNPLFRSGLLLTGAGDILNESAYNFNTKDGILTAYEAMNLNLDQTELVVLSACETGLGEVQAGEGVFGLQRSFLVAGADNVIMSLFKVSDEATKALMIKFYQKWLDSGDKHRSLVQAKKEIREKFKYPLYWGAFVMLGLD